MSTWSTRFPERDKALSQILRQSETWDSKIVNMHSGKAYRASKDCCKPVPDINTSQWVSLSDSIVVLELQRKSDGCDSKLLVA